jgi:uncharacterized integral membrane protein
MAEGIPEETGSGKVRDRRRDASMVVTGVAAVLLVWFAIANLQSVKIHFWVETAHASLIVVIAVSAVLGMVFGSVLSRRRSRKSPSGG